MSHIDVRMLLIKFSQEQAVTISPLLKHLPSMYMALGSIPRMAKMKKKS